VDRTPRPLAVWNGYSNGGLRSGEANEAFVHGLVSAPAEVPEAALAAIAEAGDPPPAGLEPLVLTAGLEPLVLTAAEESSACLGAPPAFADYPRAEIVESGRAVAVVRGRAEICCLRGRGARPSRVDARLARPLGARVLVDLESSPCELTLA
jgi:hypothetical protein